MIDMKFKMHCFDKTTNATIYIFDYKVLLKGF